MPSYIARYSRGTPIIIVTFPSRRARTSCGPVRLLGITMGMPTDSGPSIPITNG